MYWRWPTSVLLALFLIPSALHAQVVDTLRLQTSQETLRADGYSTAVITAEARDRSNNLVPDGTEVRFTTTLGSIDPVATTIAGSARATLRSAAAPGTAVVLATAGRAQRELRVSFLAEGQEPPKPLRVIVCEGDYLAFSTDYGVAVAEGNARITLGSLKLQADRAQVDVQQGVVRLESKIGEANVVLTDGGITWRVGRALYQWEARQGSMAGGQVDEGRPSDQAGSPVAFSGPPLATEPQAASAQTDFAFVDLDDTGLWIVSRRISIFPGLRVQFRKAEFRPAGKKFLTLPYHTLPLTLDGTESNFVGVGSEGVTVDLPLYLGLTDRGASTLRLGYNQREGSLGAIRKGFGVDLRHRIYGDGAQDGEVLNLSRVTSSDWGAWIRHSRRWSGSLQSNAYIDFPDHRDLFAATSLSYQGKALSSVLSLSASAPRGFPLSTFSELSLQSTPRPLGGTGLLWSVISSTGYVTGPTRTASFSQGLQARVSLPGLRFSSKTRGSAALTAGRTLAGSNRGGLANFVLSMIHQVSPAANLSLNYTFDERPGFGFIGRHRVGGMLTVAGGSKWFLSTIGSYTLDSGASSLFGQFSYHLTDGLRVDLRSTYFRSRNFPFRDYEIALAKRVLGRDLILFWSRQRHRLQIEYAAATF